MSRKPAIAISGAVSLGSYEAGVMYEVLEEIAEGTPCKFAPTSEISSKDQAKCLGSLQK